MNDHAFAVAQWLYNAAFPGAATIVASGEEHRPILIVGVEGRPLAIVDMSAAPSKDYIFEAHAKFARDASAASLVDTAAALLIMEAWTTQLDTTPEGQAVSERIVEGELRVQDLPQRRESIIFNVRVGERQFLASCLIDRATKSLARAELVDVAATEGTWLGRAIGNGHGLDRGMN